GAQHLLSFEIHRTLGLISKLRALTVLPYAVDFRMLRICSLCSESSDAGAEARVTTLPAGSARRPGAGRRWGSPRISPWLAATPCARCRRSGPHRDRPR